MSFKTTLINFIDNQQFNPGLGGMIFNPFYWARKGLSEGIAKQAHGFSGKLLDVGCGSKPYEKMFTNIDSYIGVDVEQSGHKHDQEPVDVFYDGKTLPFEEKTFDSVVSFQTLEHVFHPQEFLAELHRVLKTQGKLMMTFPFVWDEHEQPYDFARYSSFGAAHLLEQQGFRITITEKINADVSVLFQLWNTFLYKKITKQKWNPYLKQILIWVLTGYANIAAWVFIKLLGKNEDLYLDNLFVAEKI